MTRGHFIAVDAGTTNLRVWLMVGGRAIARAEAMAGVRDTAREGHSGRLRTAFMEAVAEVRRQCPEVVPQRILAAGMITSSLGLAEVPHIPAPAGALELAERLRTVSFPELTELPVSLVPGIKTLDDAGALIDAMRGEETLCLGLAMGEWSGRAFTVLNLGSHWKAITVSREGRILASRTGLTGELILAIRDHTILSDAVVAGNPPIALGLGSPGRAGMSPGRAAPRAVFHRVLALRNEGTALERLAWLIGACIEADFAPLLTGGFHPRENPLVLAGPAALAGVCGKALSEGFGVDVPAVILSEADREKGFPGRSASPPGEDRTSLMKTEEWRDRLTLLLSMVALMWLVEVADRMLGSWFEPDQWGIVPRQWRGLWGLLTSPFLHADWGHLAANTVPFLVLGGLLLTRSMGQFLQVTVLVAGLGALRMVARAGAPSTLVPVD
ncbi:MAG: rhomboid family intramembrane serine protease [Verrucomicrobiales bacterium]